MLANVASPFWIYDVFIGSLATLAAAIGTHLIGRIVRETVKAGGQIIRIILGGIFPVLVNAFIIPMIFVFLCNGDEGFASIAIAY